MPGIGAPTLVSWGQVRRGTSSMLDSLQSAALSRTPAALAERCWNPPNQWSLTWRWRPDHPTHYTHPSISQPISETVGVPAAGCHCSLVGTGFFFFGLLPFHHAAPARGSLTRPSLVTMVHGHPFILLTLLSNCLTPSILPPPPYRTPLGQPLFVLDT
jgi:hypothetical protein